MTSRIIAVDPFDILVFGGTGDLAYRKLFPSLYLRDLDGQIPTPSRIVGLSRQSLTDEAFRDAVAKALRRFVGANRIVDEALSRFLSRLHFVRVDARGEDGWDALKHLIADGLDRVRAFYLATAPELFDVITHKLASHDLLTPKTRVVLEKPLGKDLRSAQEINAAVGDVLQERQIYRIDHYLGKETVQNLMALRFANLLFEPVWNKAHVDHVQITVAETVGLEGRGGYYDTAGALRDMLQNHMLQLLCLVAMEPPSAMEADALRDEKLKVLRALKPINDSNVRALTVRGQYRSGAIDGTSVPGYLEELDEPTSTTETFVALKAEVLTWRWAGVPFYLRTGKHLAGRRTEIVVAFRPAPYRLFKDTPVDSIAPNIMRLQIDPVQGTQTQFNVKLPGPTMRLGKAETSFRYGDIARPRPNVGYETLFYDCMIGDTTLFQRADAIESAWAAVEQVQAAWVKDAGGGATALQPYASGSEGPKAADELLRRDGRCWLPLGGSEADS
jgi:glucose-6-phosphate 1-dehydrogenase